MVSLATLAPPQPAFSKPPASVPPVPPLREGDELGAAEFHRRYAAMPKHVKAELLEGVVRMASPALARGHSVPHGSLFFWARYYAARTRGVLAAPEPTVRLDGDNEVQPDVVLLLPPAAGGLAAIGADDYIHGPPAFVGEVANTSAYYDLGPKRRAYERCGVAECLVWRTQPGEVDWFVLEGGRYVRLEPDGDGMLRSRVFPGLWLPPAALLADDGEGLMAAVDAGRATPEHAAFAAKLAAAAAAGAP